MPILFKIISLATLFDLTKNTIGGALNGLEDVISPMLVAIVLTAGLGVGLGYGLAFDEAMALPGVFASSCTSYFVGTCVLSALLARVHGEFIKNGVTPPLSTVFSCKRAAQRDSEDQMRQSLDRPLLESA